MNCNKTGKKFDFSNNFVSENSLLPWLIVTKLFLNLKHFPESKTCPRIQKHFPESKTHPRIQKCFCFLPFWDVFWIVGSIFGFWDMFWILGSVFWFWDVFCPYEPPHIADSELEKSWHRRGENLVDCCLSWKKQNSKGRF